MASKFRSPNVDQYPHPGLTLRLKTADFTIPESLLAVIEAAQGHIFPMSH
jgi:hypothetical protein